MADPGYLRWAGDGVREVLKIFCAVFFIGFAAVAHLSLSLDGREISTRDGRLSLHSLDRLVIRYLMTPAAPGDKSKFPAGFLGVIPEDIGDRKVRFSYYGDKHAKSVKCPYRVGERVVGGRSPRPVRQPLMKSLGTKSKRRMV